MDLRHLALILDAGRQAADDMEDAALSKALWDMTEVAVALHLDPTGGLFNLEDGFARLAERLS